MPQKTFHIILLLASLALLNSCKDEAKFTEINFGNKYLLEVPAYMKGTTTLNEDADLQFQSPEKEHYLIVVAHTKDEFGMLQAVSGKSEESNDKALAYAAYLLGNYHAVIAEYKQLDLKTTKINGHNACTAAFSGKVNGIPVYYKAAFIEGRDDMYQVLTWTLMDNKSTYEEVMNRILLSFHETVTII